MSVGIGRVVEARLDLGFLVRVLRRAVELELV